MQHGARIAFSVHILRGVAMIFRSAKSSVHSARSVDLLHSPRYTIPRALFCATVLFSAVSTRMRGTMPHPMPISWLFNEHKNSSFLTTWFRAAPARDGRAEWGPIDVVRGSKWSGEYGGKKWRVNRNTLAPKKHETAA